MAKVRLKNIRKNPRRPIVLNLDRAAASIVINRRRLEETRQGDRRIRMERVVVPGSIRVPYNGLSEAIDEKLLECAEVKAALKSRKVAVTPYRPSLEERRAAKAAAREAAAAPAAKTTKKKSRRASASSQESAEPEPGDNEATKGTSTESTSSKGRS